MITVATISLGAGVPPAAFQLSADRHHATSPRSTPRSTRSRAQRAQFGAVQNRLEHTLSNLAVYHENLMASESRIRDVDMAAEMVNFTKLQILQQAGTAMLAQANQTPQSVLQLLQGLARPPSRQSPSPVAAPRWRGSSTSVGSLGVRTLLVAFASFGVGVGLAELFGASNLGVAFGFGQIAFALGCVALMLRGG